MLRAVLKSLRMGVVTTAYPDVASAAEAGGGYAIDLGLCVFCGRCAAPDGAIEMGREFELAARRRADLVVEIRDDGEGHAVREPRAGEAAGTATDAVAAAIERTLERSLHLRHLDAGSCNACDWELAALINPTTTSGAWASTSWLRLAMPTA